jgi:hypothetical protein
MLTLAAEFLAPHTVAAKFGDNSGTTQDSARFTRVIAGDFDAHGILYPLRSTVRAPPAQWAADASVVPDDRAITLGRHHIPFVAAEPATIGQDAILPRPCDRTGEGFALTQRARPSKRGAEARVCHGALLNKRRCAGGQPTVFTKQTPGHQQRTRWRIRSGRAASSDLYGPRGSQRTVLEARPTPCACAGG